MLVGPHDGIWESQLVARHQPAEMIGMHVGEVDLVDLLRLISRRQEVGQKLAQGRTEQRTRAGVDQY